jgi:hypothetical protein
MAKVWGWQALIIRHSTFPIFFMAYDPNWPPFHADASSEGFRTQFQGLKALIDAQAGQIAALQAALDSVPPGQAVLTLQYAGGLDVPMLLAAPRATSLLLQRRYEGGTDWPTVATLQWGGPDYYTDTLPGTGVFEYRLIGVNAGGPGTPSEVGTVSAV